MGIPHPTESTPSHRPSGISLDDARHIVSRAKHQADEILKKARELLSEAKAVQGADSLDIEERRALARRIGFDEGYRVGLAEAESSVRNREVLDAVAQDSPEEVAILEEVALRLQTERTRFDSEKRRFFAEIRQIVDRSSSRDDSPLIDALLAFMQKHPPTTSSSSAASVAPRDSSSGHGRRRRRRKEEVPG